MFTTGQKGFLDFSTGIHTNYYTNHILPQRLNINTAVMQLTVDLRELTYFCIQIQWRRQGWAKGAFAPTILSCPPPPQLWVKSRTKWAFPCTMWSKLMQPFWVSCPLKIVCALSVPSPPLNFWCPPPPSLPYMEVTGDVRPRWAFGDYNFIKIKWVSQSGHKK